MTLDNKIINFDINRNNLFNLTAKQFDTTGARSFTFRLLKNSVPFSLEGLSVKVGGKKPDYKDILNDCKIIDPKKGIVEVELTTQMQVVAGTLKLELIILKGETRLSTIPFDIQVIKSAINFKEVESSSEFGALQEALWKTDNVYTKQEVDSKTWDMSNMGQDVKEAMTGGSVAVVGVDAVKENNISNLQVTPVKLSTSVLQRDLDYDTYKLVSNNTSLYILPNPLLFGLANITTKCNNNGTIKVCLLNKNSDTSFIVKNVKDFNVFKGVNSINCAFECTGDGTEYIGIMSNSLLLYKPYGGNGFYEIKNYTGELGYFETANNTSLEYDLAINVIYENYNIYKSLYNRDNSIKDYFNSLINGELSCHSNISFDDYLKKSSETSLYIPNESLLEGYISICSKCFAGNISIYILEKATDTTFTIKHKESFVIQNDGMNEFNIDYRTSGNGKEYIGIISTGGIAYKTNGGTIGFYEKSNFKNDCEIASTISVDKSYVSNESPCYTFLFAYYLKYRTKSLKDIDSTIFKLSKKTYDIEDKIKSIETPSIKLTDFLTPRYSEIKESYGFVGRWFEKEIEGVKHMVTINEGSEFYFKVKNTTTVSLIFKVITSKEIPYFAYSIDGGEFIRQKITEPLLQEITTDEHIIRVIIDGLTETENKWYEEMGVAFEKAIVDESGLIIGIYPRNKKIMFYGDSITEGVRVLGMEANANENSSIGAFPFVTCKNVNAISYRVGFGGSGVTQGGNGGVPKCLSVIDNMTYMKKAPYFEPDLIVINHGTNDSGANSTIFKTEYNKVLDRLKIKYSGVPIFAVIPFNQRHAQDIRDCVTDRKYCYLIETSGWKITYTDSIHPNIKGGKIAGEKLANEIIKILGKNFFY
ncbi:BppU family phage baseplate upper protein [Clostridium perfringens]|uniref:BppU family phage baseplate upper protein n=1 Tax=Clostridium perfringens TaxID=1502 RepID=UPI0013E344CD|nr:BppU family phage baseplate upper protein [Clostridium perfringens]NGT96493.1 BppU family phage baseplate upper protein [Clostridium perfringens]